MIQKMESEKLEAVQFVKDVVIGLIFVVFSFFVVWGSFQIVNPGKI